MRASRSIRRTALLGVVASAVGLALVSWGYLPGSRSITMTRRVLQPGDVVVDESGRGPAVLIVSDEERGAMLASRLAERHRVIVTAPDPLTRDAGRTLLAALDGLDLAGNVTLVASVTTMAKLREVFPAVRDRVSRVIVLDAGHDTREDDVVAVLSGGYPLFALSHAQGPLWTRYRSHHVEGVTLSLVDACADGMTQDCIDEASTLTANIIGRPAATPTGTTMQDAMRSGAPGPFMITVPDGQFRKGASDEPADRSGVPMKVTRRLMVARTETTVAEFRRFVERTGRQIEKGCWFHTKEQEWKLSEQTSWSHPIFPQGDDHPVTCVTFEDAQAYADWMRSETGQPYRLPTEAEFEFANRAGRSGPYSGVRDAAELCSAANGADRSSGFAYANPCTDEFAETAPVASFPANDFGLHDTLGNLWELTTGCHATSYLQYLPSLLPERGGDASASDGGACPGRHVLKGGLYISSPANLRVTHRESEGYRSTRIGFRVVREVP